MTTIHYGKDEGANGLIAGASPDAGLMRFTTAGIQLNSQVGFAILSRLDHKLKLNGGGVLRFQSTSYPSIYIYY